MTSGAGIPILMYHSVSDEGPGPIALPTASFREQLAVLVDSGARGISVSDYVAARRDNRALAPGAVVLTFDDGYRDFADVVFPLLPDGWRCTVFLPVAPIDGDRPSHFGDGYPRPLLTWRMVEDLAIRGVEFGAHSMTHRDLTRLTPEAAREEIALSGQRIRERAGCRVEGFAAPFGRATQALRDEMKRHYAWSVGTTMRRASERSDLFDLPRIEMWYFRDARRWRSYVSRGWTPYFALRQTVRSIKNFVIG
jgi:peptidoglycan/xylan/chitin deacetylase (PgdA/CDA1 family)